ncbi:hypothetical protein KQI41_18325 [Tissierella pigra]|uniref:YvlB/LiaX N-terminal domain-containing protein n=1 Tax=Tissierella pigra TaxID=2607614 RepID=A0A6N7XJA3_9FIRM|nr:hypothetical protein [Tissierella pigra]MBU5428352.1 hypothetical protein [Tissierella pigra]MSU01676.1 hypothetical protein [Tissierella pigra]
MSEKLQILNMVQEGKITAEEGVKLLEALEDNKKISNNLVYSDNKAKWLKIKVIESGDITKANVTLPISLVNVGVKLIGKFSPEIKASGLTEDDIGEILEAIKNGQMGKIVDVDTEDGTKVEITIE